MDMSKEELLGHIQRLASDRRKKAADLKGERDALAEIDGDFPAKKELTDLAGKTASAGAKLQEQRKSSEEYQNQNSVVLEAKADLDTVEDSLSNYLTLYMVKTQKKAVHAFPSDDASIDREITVVAKIGSKVPANTSLFDDPEE